jgi:hypothetical protein
MHGHGEPSRADITTTMDIITITTMTTMVVRVVSRARTVVRVRVVMVPVDAASPTASAARPAFNQTQSGALDVLLTSSALRR